MEVITNPVRKRKTPRHMSNIDLRPCEVCGGKSSGFHFGAITCEACKSFFRRTIKSDITYSCFRQKSNEPCVIRLVKGGIAPCPACRWKRCQELNMSANAVKKGRYTHSKKAEAINISKEYWDANSSSKDSNGISDKDESLSPEEPSSSTSPTSSSSPSASSATSPASLSESNSGSSITSATSMSTSSSLVSVSSEDGIPEINFNFNLTDVLQEVQEEPGAPSFVALRPDYPTQRIQAIQSEADSTIQMLSQCCDIGITLQLDSPAPEIENELDIKNNFASSADIDILGADVIDEETHLRQIAEAVATVYDHQNFLTKGFLSKVSWMQYQHMKEKEMNKELFGDLPTLAVKDHQNFLEQTGIDLDGRLDSLQKFLNGLEPTVRKFISFTKGIPGFQLLSREDQISMIQKTNVVLMETIYFPCHNIESGVIANPFRTGLRCIDHKLKSALIGQERVDIIRPIIKYLQDLDLTDQENALMSSVCIMHPDACVTDDGKRTCTLIHDKLHKALKKLLLRRYPDNEAVRMMQTIENDVRQRLHEFCVPHFSQQWKGVMRIFGQTLSVPQLLLEWFNVDGP